MRYSPELARLSDRCAADPADRAFAALADGLRKAGALDEAERVARAGVERRPDYVPGWLALARVLAQQGAVDAARDALRSALGVDATHPVVLAQLSEIDGVLPDATPAVVVADTAEFMPELASPPRQLVGFEEAEDIAMLAEQDDAQYTAAAAAAAADDAPVDEALHEDALLLTESLAMIYRRQGHLDRALEVFEALVTRDPENAALAERRDAVRAERDAQRPRPYRVPPDGPSMTTWLASIAATRTARRPATSSFDAFYQPPAGPPAETSDLAAFQAWLKELER